MSFADRNIKNKVLPVPREAVAHVDGHERTLLEEEIRAFRRMREHEQTLLTRAQPSDFSGRVQPPKPKITTDIRSLNKKLPALQRDVQTTLQSIVKTSSSASFDDSPSARIGSHYSPIWNGVPIVGVNAPTLSAVQSNSDFPVSDAIPKVGIKKTGFLPLEIVRLVGKLGYIIIHLLTLLFNFLTYSTLSCRTSMSNVLHSSRGLSNGQVMIVHNHIAVIRLPPEILHDGSYTGCSDRESIKLLVFMSPTRIDVFNLQDGGQRGPIHSRNRMDIAPQTQMLKLAKRNRRKETKSFVAQNETSRSGNHCI